MMPSNYIQDNEVPIDEDMSDSIDPETDSGHQHSEEELEALAIKLAEEQSTQQDFYRNLAEDLSEQELGKLAGELLGQIDDDKESRSQWIAMTSKLFDNLGFNIQESRQEPFVWCTGAVDSTMSTAIINSLGVCLAEMLPPGGPARAKVLGTIDENKENKAIQLEESVNWYLTQFDKVFTPDAKQAYLWAIATGTGPKKVYWDPIDKKVKSRKIKPEDLIVNTDCNSILESDRLTHVIRLSKNEIHLRMQNGVYREIELSETSGDGDTDSELDTVIKGMEGITSNDNDKRSLYECYEIHAHKNIKGIDKDISKDDISLPYIITIETQSRKVLNIVRNWRKNDDSFKRKECFVIIQYLPGFGIYGLGIGQIAGSNAIALTSIQRQLIDAGTLRNFPGGMRKKGLKIEKYDKNVPPGGFVEVETDGLPISDVVMMMPYGEPSVVLSQLREKLVEETLSILNTAEKQIASGNPNAPVGTTIALLESSSRVQTIILQGMHYAQTLELQMIFDLLAEHLPDEPFIAKMPGKEVVLDKSLFSDDFQIVPVSDPRVTTSTQRIIREESIMKVATPFAQFHDMREILKRFYQAMNIQQIDKILPPPPKPQALDAITENMMFLQQKPVVAAPFQDHKAHRILHSNMAQQLLGMGNIPAYTEIMIHDQVHEAYDFIQNMPMQAMYEEIPGFINHMVMTGQMSPQQAEELSQVPPEQLMQDPMIQMNLSQSQKVLEANQRAEQMMMMPKEVLLADPMVQNFLSQKAAQELMEQQKKMMEEQQNAPKPMDPTTAMYQSAMADVQQKSEAAQLKMAETEMKTNASLKETEMKTEAEAFKVTHDFEKEKMKIEANQQMADEKNQANVAIAEMKQGPII